MHNKRQLITAVLKSAFLVSLLVSSIPVHAQDSRATSGDPIKWSGDGLRVELQSLTPDLARAFFIGRGFPKKDVELLANEACVFRSAIGHTKAEVSADANVGAGSNSSDTSVTIELKKWRVITGDKSHGVRTREMWREIWDKRKLDPSAAVAFHWALIPTEQTYQPTDYNWGMLTFMGKPGTMFDLEIAWRHGDNSKVHIFKGLQCGENAKD